MKKSTLLIMLIVTTLTIGQTPPGKMKLHNSAEAMRQEIERLIQIGKSVTDAQQILQVNGFECSMRKQNSFIEMKEDRTIVEHKNLDFLFCEKRIQLLTNTRVSQVAVIHKNNVVSDLLSSVDTSPVLRKKDYIKMSDTDIRKLLLKFAPLGSSEYDVKKMLRDVFHRSFTEDGFVLSSKMQRYNRRILESNWVEATWYFDMNGVLKNVAVSHQWDGV
jgi:hypothetical protein